RGEIAVRIVRACRDMGIRSAVVFAPSDRGSLAVRLADEAWRADADGRPAYLDIPGIMAMAQRIGADALHPGYGFLSERAELAEACAAVGITFVGPTPDNIRTLGDKNAARRVMAQAGVPLVPGVRDVLKDAESARAAAAGIGYPVLIKAAFGGGGRGMRVVSKEADMSAAFEAATREAAAAFGRGDVYLEKFFPRPRHIEVQVAADNFGRVVVFPERECSIQRRFQKMVEESPSPFLTPEVRARLLETVARGAAAAGYRNVGTFEFLFDENRGFYFLEVNTRLQVEHPITEEVTGVDLVALQIRLAAGEPMPMAEDQVAARGWSFEARITGENPYADFVPAPGQLHHVRFPQGPGVRVDSGVESGSAVSPHFDSLLAKLITRGADREQARHRMLRALDEMRITGLPTTVPFHQWLFREPRFIEGDLWTQFLAEVPMQLPAPREQDLPLAAALAAVTEARRIVPVPSGWR
ncbi:MAG: acetyl-CoA carboxylase biotin carboxylase subunit, partial [Candidatus Xenobia bacterium]